MIYWVSHKIEKQTKMLQGEIELTEPQGGAAAQYDVATLKANSWNCLNSLKTGITEMKSSIYIAALVPS